MLVSTPSPPRRAYKAVRSVARHVALDGLWAVQRGTGEESAAARAPRVHFPYLHAVPPGRRPGFVRCSTGSGKSTPLLTTPRRWTVSSRGGWTNPTSPSASTTGSPRTCGPLSILEQYGTTGCFFVVTRLLGHADARGGAGSSLVTRTPSTSTRCPGLTWRTSRRGATRSGTTPAPTEPSRRSRTPGSRTRSAVRARSCGLDWARSTTSLGPSGGFTTSVQERGKRCSIPATAVAHRPSAGPTRGWPRPNLRSCACAGTTS